MRVFVFFIDYSGSFLIKQRKSRRGVDVTGSRDATFNRRALCFVDFIIQLLLAFVDKGAGLLFFMT